MHTIQTCNHRIWSKYHCSDTNNIWSKPKAWERHLWGSDSSFSLFIVRSYPSNFKWFYCVHRSCIRHKRKFHSLMWVLRMFYVPCLFITQTYIYMLNWVCVVNNIWGNNDYKINKRITWKKKSEDLSCGSGYIALKDLNCWDFSKCVNMKNEHINHLKKLSLNPTYKIKSLFFKQK